MCVEMPLRVGLTAGGALMKSHGVRKRDAEEIVVPDGEATKDVAEQVQVRGREIRECADVPAAKNHSFKRPDRPVGDQRHEGLVFADDADDMPALELQIVAQQTGAVCALIFEERIGFAGGNVRDGFGCPNLAVRMRIAGAHERAAILEDLDVTNPGESLE